LTQPDSFAPITSSLFDRANLNTNVCGPEEPVSPAVDGTCGHDTPYAFMWSQTIGTTENVGGTTMLGFNIGKLVPIVQFSVSLTYGFAWTQSKTVGGNISYTTPKGQRMHLFRKAKLNDVSGQFFLSGPGDTNYLIPHATFKWADPSGDGIISPGRNRWRTVRRLLDRRSGQPYVSPATLLAVDDTWLRRTPTLTGSVATWRAEPVPSWPFWLPPQAHSRPRVSIA
jgi:hypothetical protein